MSATDLPFEVFRKIFSYLPLEEIIQARAVSKQWCCYIDHFNITHLFYSQWPRQFVLDHRRLTAGLFAPNCIRSLNFECFFNAYASSIFANLRHLRICDLNSIGGSSALFTQLSGSFEHLKCLDLIRIANLDAQICLKSASIQHLLIDDLDGVEQLVLETPELLNVQIWFRKYPGFDLRFAYPESVQSIEFDLYNGFLDAGGFTNLRSIRAHDLVDIAENALQDMRRLKEVHLIYPYASLRSLQNQKHLYKLNDLRIYYHGLCLSMDEYLDSSDWLNESVTEMMLEARNQSKLADWLPYETIGYMSIERLIAQIPDTFWKRFANLRKLYVAEDPQNVQQFREFLGKFEHILELEFIIDGPRCQRLLDQLADYCPSVQIFSIHCGAGLNFDFVLRFPHLTTLSIDYSGGLYEEKLILAIFRELRYLRKLLLNGCNCRLEINTRKPNEFELKINDQDFLVFSPEDLVQAFRYWSSKLLFFSRFSWPMNGNGIDRHLFGLQLIAHESGMERPSFFDDPIFKLYGPGSNYSVDTSPNIERF